MTLGAEVDNLVFENGQLESLIFNICSKLAFYSLLIDSKISVYNRFETDNERILKDLSELMTSKEVLNSLISDLDHVRERKNEFLNSVAAIVKYHKDLDEDDIERIKEL